MSTRMTSMLKVTTFVLLGLASAIPAGSAQTVAADSAAPQRAGSGDGPMSNRASNIVAADTRSPVAPSLPASPAGVDAAVRDYLRAARVSLNAGRTGEAQQSLEMAETRALTRSVTPEQAAMPDGNPMVTRIRDALHALGEGNRSHALEVIDMALSS